MQAPERRFGDRVAIDATVGVRRRGSARYDVGLRDFSRQGCALEMPERFDPDDPVFVTLPGLSVLRSDVVWAEYGTAGMMFATPLHPAVFDMMARRMSEPAVTDR